MLTVKSLIEHISKWLSDVLSMGGVSEKMSPTTIVAGSNNPDFNRKITSFGGYAMVYTGTIII